MTTPKDNVLHLMEGQGASQPVAFALKWPDDERLNLSTVFDTEEEAINYMEQCSDGVVVVPLFAAPKTAHDHWVDEVEASGEAEKHAADSGLVAAATAVLEMCEQHGDFRNGVTDPTGTIDEGNVIASGYFEALRNALGGPHFAISPSTDVATLQRELALAYEGLERERAITKEQGEHIKELAGAMKGVGEMLNEAYEHWDADREMKVGKILLALLDYKIRYDKRSDAWHAALSKVQHVAARGAEVSE